VTGYLVPPQDGAALAEAMLRFVEQPDAIPSMGAAARRRVVDKFDEGLVLHETLRDYRRLMGREFADDAQSTAS
jgi:glycosyltransferase involved in cell wall biosynthesis